MRLSPSLQHHLAVVFEVVPGVHTVTPLWSVALVNATGYAMEG